MAHQLNSVDIIMCLLGFFMYSSVVLCPGFNFIACISVVANIFPHHSQGGWSWTNFYICRAWYGSFGPAVPILIRRVLNSRTYIQKGIARYLDDFEGQRINFWSDAILQAPYFDIYASWTFEGYLFLWKWCHRRLRYNIFELSFISLYVEFGHKSTRMYIDFYMKR